MDEKTENYLTDIIKHLPGSIYWKDKNGVYLGCNDFVLQMAGTDQVVGKTDFDLPWKEYAQQIINADKKVMETGVPLELEEHPTLASGQQVVMLTRKSPLKDKQGNTIGILGISVDITQQKALEEKLRNTEAREARFKAMSALGGMIAHELRTPLTTIGMGILPIQQVLPPLIQAYEKSVARGEIEPIPKRLLGGMEKSVDYVIRAVNYAQTTINTILEGFHYSEDDVQIDMVSFSLKSMLEKAIAEYPFDVEEEAWIKVKHIDDVFILGEEQMVIHVFYNLLKNALHVIHAEGKGSISVWSELDKDKVHLYVEDTAKGISPKELSKIFEPFYTTKKETAVSVGLGLYFCKTVLQKMKADITCESEFGSYTRFKVTLPLAEKSEL